LVGSIIGEWGLTCTQIKLLVPFGAQKEATIGEILGIRKIFLSQINGQNALIFSMKQFWEKEIQICANKVPGVINAPTPRKGPKRGNFLKIF